MSGRTRNYPSTPVEVWCCLNPAHREVYWRGDVAACADCGLTSQMTAEFAREVAAAEQERIAAQVEAYAANYPEDVFPPTGTSRDAIGGTAMQHAYRNAARMIREENR